ncbi:MAG TPA: HD-GYP domain-containing protein [Actinomycetota bacterium]|nr:HD-GYP domain-containing protein [Actinomycetota bacterium]
MSRQGSRDQGDLVAFARDARTRYVRERDRAHELERALADLNDAYFSTIETLAFLIEAKDAGTRRHLDRTRDLALELTQRIEPELMDQSEIGHAFLLHDIGKIGIPDRILTKPGTLTDSEWAVMRTHPLIGAQVVRPIRILGEAEDVVRFHHERFDGDGYPSGLRGEEIPLAARIFSVVDAYDAMTNDRPYRAACSPEAALDELIRCSGTQFDPEVVDEFLVLMEQGDLSVNIPEQHASAVAATPA